MSRHKKPLRPAAPAKRRRLESESVAEPAAQYAGTGPMEQPWLLPGKFDSSMGLAGLIEAMMPDEVPTPAMVLQARLNAAARARLIEEFGLLTGGQIAEINESAAENRAALASRWKGERKIFSVQHRGSVYYPAFQFDRQGRPRAVVARILAALGEDEGWETALWFISANGYLDGASRPVDLLDEDPAAVVAAAEKAGDVPC